MISRKTLIWFSGQVFLMNWSALSMAEESAMKISITLGNKVIQATLLDNPTAREFISQLPLTLTLTDYNSTEKVSDLPKKLTKKDAPAAIDPSIGDITYYAPWGNLAIFYRDFGHSPGLIKLGTINSGIEALSVPGPIKATISLVNPESTNQER